MTTIVEAMKSREIRRIEVGNRWLVWNEYSCKWIVRDSYRRGKRKIVIETTDEAEAVAALLGEENDEQ